MPSACSPCPSRFLGKPPARLLCQAVWGKAPEGIRRNGEWIHLPHHRRLAAGLKLHDGGRAAADRPRLPPWTLSLSRCAGNFHLLFLVFVLARLLVGPGAVLARLLCRGQHAY